MYTLLGLGDKGNTLPNVSSVFITQIVIKRKTKSKKLNNEIGTHDVNF